MAQNDNTLLARPLVDLSTALEGYADPIAFGADYAGAIWCVAPKSTEEPYETEQHKGSPKTRRSAPTDHLVLRWHEGRTQSLVLTGEQTVFSYVQPLPNGILLAGARCRYRKEGAEKNALAVDWSGKELGRWTLGDGIEDLRATPNGTLWVSYFDEGIFGNLGWHTPGVARIGASGLAAFSSDGERTFEYDAEAARTEAICDTYALNVVGDDDVWIYFYDQFPIVRIHQGRYQLWRTKISGARALAIDDRRALLYGDYNRRGLVRALELGDKGATTVTSERFLVDDEGEPIRKALVYGVGKSLYVFGTRAVRIVSDW